MSETDLAIFVKSFENVTLGNGRNSLKLTKEKNLLESNKINLRKTKLIVLRYVHRFHETSKYMYNVKYYIPIFEAFNVSKKQNIKT